MVLLALYRWIWAPAQWWEFWMPQSGAAGGAIACLVAIIVLAFV